MKSESNKKDKELSGLLKSLFLFIVISCIFGYVGYTFCLDNGYDLKRGIIFGALFPMGIAIIKEFNFDSFFTYIIYTIAYLIILEFLPTLIGIVVLFIIISIYIIWFIKIIVNNKQKDNKIKIETKNDIVKNTKKIKTEYRDVKDKEYIYNLETKDEYYCERCDREISEEEYEEYCGLCEDCYSEVYFGERYNGDDYDLYK